MKKGQVEQHERVDSYRLGGTKLLAGHRLLPFQWSYDVNGDPALLVGDQQIMLSSAYNASGRMTFFLCPYCGQRVRFLYLPGFKCRACAGLNYRSQQLSKKRLAAERQYEKRLEGANNAVEREIAELEHRLELLKQRLKNKNLQTEWI